MACGGGCQAQHEQFLALHRPHECGKAVPFHGKSAVGIRCQKRQVRHISAARFTAESWDLQCDCCCLLAHVLAEMAAARAADGSAVFPAAQLLKARRRAVEGHLDKI